MLMLAIIVITVVISLVSESSNSNSAGNIIKKQGEFNAALRAKFRAESDEYYRQKYGKEYERITGGCVKADVPVPIPGVHVEDYFK